MHEMGAAIAAGLARKAGWQVTYLGPSLPAEEIVGAVMANQFRAVALSIIYPEDDPDLPAQLIRLRQLLPDQIPIIAGGRAVASYREALDGIGALILTEMSDFTRLLEEIRAGSPAASVRVS
jgi:methylmalonyl-CoA mutase cobalamin-binding subunit